MFGVVAVINLSRICFYLIASELYPRWRRRLVAGSTLFDRELPDVVVITPAHNEGTTLNPCLESVSQLDYPWRKVLHIIVDDGSRDDTALVAEHFKMTHPHRRIHVIRQKNQGKASALNNALEYLAANPEFDNCNIFMCLDADSQLHPQALRRGVEYFRNDGVKAVATHVKIVPEKGLLNYVQRFEYLTSYRMKRAQTVLGFDYIIGGIGSMMRRDAFDQVGRYETNTITEDIDASMKLLHFFGNRRPTCIYAADVISYTEACPNFRSLMTQRYRWKFGRSQTFYKRREMFFSKSGRFKRSLTWVFLPLEVAFDFVFLIEPVFLFFLGYLIVRYGDWRTMLGALVTVSVYMTINAWREPYYSKMDRAKFILSAPLLYVANYALSIAEYSASTKTVSKLHTIPESIVAGHQTWSSPPRSGAASKQSAPAATTAGVHPDAVGSAA